VESSRYQIRESSKYYGKYVVVDTLTNEVYEFYNLASAVTFIKKQNKE